MKPFKEWAEEYGISVEIRPPMRWSVIDNIMSDIPISESEFTGKVVVKQMRIIDHQISIGNAIAYSH